MSEQTLQVGGRYLLRRLWSRCHEEHLVAEISPSGEFFKSGDQWLSREDYRIVEKLPEKKP
jgi:hypothetical protein